MYVPLFVLVKRLGLLKKNLLVTITISGRVGLRLRQSNNVACERIRSKVVVEEEIHAGSVLSLAMLCLLSDELFEREHVGSLYCLFVCLLLFSLSKKKKTQSWLSLGRNRDGQYD